MKARVRPGAKVLAQHFVYSQADRGAHATCWLYQVTVGFAPRDHARCILQCIKRGLATKGKQPTATPRTKIPPPTQLSGEWSIKVHNDLFDISRYKDLGSADQGSLEMRLDKAWVQLTLFAKTDSDN